MIETQKALVVDIDGTICPIKKPGQHYADLMPEPQMLARLQALEAEGWHIILHTARGMRTHDGNPGKIAKHVGPELLSWLAKHGIPFHELHLAKPWPGHQGVYVDDRAVRPREFVDHNLEELEALMARDRIATDDA